MLSKKIIIPLIALAAFGLALFGLDQVYAQTAGTNKSSALVQMIAQKFGLDQGQVQSVFDQYRQDQRNQMQQKRQQNLEDSLSQALKDGKINETQKQAILARFGELKTNNDPNNFKNMAPDQRKEAFANRQNDLKTWAQSQGIDPTVLSGLLGMHRPGMWGKGQASPKP